MKKPLVLRCAALLALSVGLFLTVHRRPGGGYDALVAIVCDGQGYEELDGAGYLSFTTDVSGHAVAKRIQVREPAIMQSLSALNAGEVIGVNRSLSVPARALAERHPDVGAIDSFQLLAEDAWDDCFSVIGISVS